MIDLLDGGLGGTHPASYYAATAHASAPCQPLAGSASYDVCIVGAGYTGLSAALFLAKKGYRVAVLEANRVGWGASGRNGGQLGSGQRLDQIKLEKLFGLSKARQLWDLAEESKALVKSLVAEHRIDCDLKPGVIYADHKRQFSAESAAYVDVLNTRYGYEKIKYLDAEGIRHEIGSAAYFSGTLDNGAGHLHPLNFALGLAGAARAAGADIFEGTRVEKLAPGSPARLHTRSGTVSADHVIVAGNGYVGRLEPRTAAHVMPINSYMIATAPLDGDLARYIIRNDVAVADTRFVVNYFRLSADKRLLFGGLESYGYGTPKNVAELVRRRVLTIFPQLAQVSIDYSWGGTLAITRNRLPYLARPWDNVLVAGGYSGHGLGLSTLCGRLMGEAIAGQAEKFDILATLPIPGFPGGSTMRQPLLILAMLYYSMRDKF
jgi:gamma-glutamylputrescine oxidase